MPSTGLSPRNGKQIEVPCRLKAIVDPLEQIVGIPAVIVRKGDKRPTAKRQDCIARAGESPTAQVEVATATPGEIGAQRLDRRALRGSTLIGYQDFEVLVGLSA